MVESVVQVLPPLDSSTVDSAQYPFHLVEVIAFDDLVMRRVTILRVLRICHDVVYIELDGVYPDFEDAAQFLEIHVSYALTTMTAVTYPEEANEVGTFEVPSLRICELGPDLLECTHLFSSNRFRSAGHLEHVVETLDDHTSEQVGEDVL